jgi:hypothetical protein
MGAWMSFVAVILLICSMLVADDQQPNYRAQASYDSQNCTVYKAPTRDKKPGYNNTDGISDECVFRVDEDKDGWDYALIISTMIFSAALVGIGCAQVHWMGKTHAATKSASDAAETQGKILEAIERPWLMAIREGARPDGWPLPFTDIEANFRITWKATNFGNSPAFVTLLFSRVEVLEYPICDEPPEARESDINQMVVSPGAYCIQAAKKHISPVEVAEIKAGKKCVVFFGLIKYESRLGKTKPHHSKFCEYWFYKDTRPEDAEIGPKGWVDYT